MILDAQIPDTYQIDLPYKSNQISTISYPREWFMQTRELLGGKPILVDIFFADGEATTIYLNLVEY
jgi:hypothetical protein